MFGLEPIDPLIYDVACNLAEMHMDDVGLQVSPQHGLAVLKSTDPIADPLKFISLASLRRNGTIFWSMMPQPRRFGRA
jgi:hypothetical protein